MSAGLSLHQLCVLDASPAELVAIAGQVGCAQVSLFTHVPERARGFYPEVTAADVPGAARRPRRSRRDGSATSRSSRSTATSRPIAIAAALEVGAALGATRGDGACPWHRGCRRRDRAASPPSAASRRTMASSPGSNSTPSPPSATSPPPPRSCAARAMGSLVLDTLHLMRGDGGRRGAGRPARPDRLCPDQRRAAAHRRQRPLARGRARADAARRGRVPARPRSCGRCSAAR